MVERILGIDLGISSLGWAVIEYDTETGLYRIIDCGVRLFTKGTNNDDESLAKNRREKRLTRRRLNRLSIRKEQVRQLCIKYHLATQEELNGENYAQGIFHEPNKKDVWELRHDALYRELSDKELARVLLHLSAHRGFKFLPYDINNFSSEDKTQTEKNASLLMERVKNANCHTIGEYRWKYSQHSGLKRFSKKHDDALKILKKAEQPIAPFDWQLTARRDDVLVEAKIIFDMQRQFGKQKATIELENEFCGSDKNGKLMWVADPKSVEDMVGYCKYFPSEKRAPASSPTTEKFITLSTLINCRIIDWDTNQEIKVTDLQSIDNLLEFIYQKEETTYKQFRDFLNLKSHQTFKGLLYGNTTRKKKSKKLVSSALIKEEKNQLDLLFTDKSIEEKRFIAKLKGTKQLQNTLGEHYTQLDHKSLDKIAFICSVEKTKNARKERLIKELNHDMIAQLCSSIEFSKFIELSSKALYMVLPEMLNGNRYDQAIELIGLEPKEKGKLIPSIKKTKEEGIHAQPRARILNPSVLRALSEFRKVANALVRKYGSQEDKFAPFHRVYFELPRDFKTIEEKMRENEKNTHNKNRNDEIDKILQNEHGIVSPKQKHREMYKLWEQQSEICTYCQSQLKLEKVFSVEGYAEIDHILPRSRSFDNSFQNKILVHATCNQNKLDKTPFEWLNKNEPNQWEKIKNFLASPTIKQKMGTRKINNILKDNFSDTQSIREFSERNLNDTSYICKAVKDFCEDYWQLAPLPNNGNQIPKQIAVRNGRLTSFLRYQWGVSSKENKKDRSTHSHHAEDALIVAFSTESMVKKLSQYYRDKETMPKNKAPHIPEPIKNIRTEIASHLITEKTEVITAKDGGKVTLKRLLISRPPRASITGAAHKEGIFSPIYKTKKDPKGNFDKFGNAKEKGGYTLIKSQNPIAGNSGLHEQDSMPRVDIFTKDGKYYLVPIYVADFAKGELPNKAIVAGKDKDGNKREWLDIDDNYKFQFSLFKDDIVEISNKKIKAQNVESVVGYFVSADSSTANITIKKADNSEDNLFKRDIDKKTNEKKGDSLLSFGLLQGILYFKKLQIDPLGYYYEVKGEKRLGTIPQEAQKRPKRQK